jgi:hypothetical protein
MPCINKWLELVVNFMIHDTHFNKIAFFDWSKMFKMLKHVFYNLFYAITTSNMIKEVTKNVFNN